MAMMAHVFISGFVQGVGFRQFIKWKARSLGIKGWVKNLPADKAGLPDSRVEAKFLGEKVKVEKIIRICRKGPFLSKVKEVTVIWEEEEQTYTDFEVR